MLTTDDQKTSQRDYLDKVRDSVKFLQNASYKEMREFHSKFKKDDKKTKYFDEVDDASPDDLHYKILYNQVFQIFRSQNIDFDPESKVDLLRNLQEKEKQIHADIEFLEKTIIFLRNNTKKLL